MPTPSPSRAREATRARLRPLAPTLGILLGGTLLAAAVAVVGRASSPLDRVANLDLSNGLVSDTYLMSSKTEPDRCYIATRRQSTMRRDDAGVAAPWLDCVSFGMHPDRSGLPSYFLGSKKEGMRFFVPVDDIPDWTYPFLYGFVRERFPDLELPNAQWTQLFVDRVYAGLYLDMRLPLDKRKKDGGPEIRREIVMVDGVAAGQVDSRFLETGTALLTAATSGLFPVPGNPEPPLAWLHARRPFEEGLYLMNGMPPHEVALLPLPVSLKALYEGLNGAPPETLIDERFTRWRVEGPEDPFDGPAEAALSVEFEAYSAAFGRALAAHGARNGPMERTAEFMTKRQASTADLGLRLGGL